MRSSGRNMCLDTVSGVSEVERLSSDAEYDVPSLQEDYLEMDYALEMEDCARYTFSQYAYVYSEPHAVSDNDGSGWSGFQQPKLKQCAQEQVPFSSHESWKNSIRLQQEDSPSFIYDHVALSLLLGEARRRHLARLVRRGASESGVAEAKWQWARLAKELLEKVELLSYEQVRKTLVTMYLFDLDGMKLQYGENRVRMTELMRNKERVLQQLKAQGKLFLTPNLDSPALGTSSPVCDGALAQPLSVFAMTCLDPSTLAGCNEDQGELYDAALYSQRSGGGLSSSASSSDSDEYTDECCSPLGSVW